MLSITYQVLHTGGDPVASGVIFENPQAIPDWYPKLPPPDRTDPIEVWTSIAQDSGHVLHITGSVSYWQASDALLQLMLERRVYEELVDQYPTARYDWHVRSESRSFNRVPRSDPDYQAQLRATIGE